MESRHETYPERRALVLTLACWILETAGCAILLLRIPSDSKNAFLFGLSKERLLMLAVFAVLLLCGILAVILRSKISGFLSAGPRVGTVFRVLAVILFFLVMLPDYRFGKQAAYFTRLKPFLIWGFLSALTFSLYCAFSKDRFSGARHTLRNLAENKREILPVLLFLIFGVLFVEITGLGKTPESSLWNKNGIPLQSIQLFLSLLIFLILKKAGLFSLLDRHRKFPHFLLIWIVSALIWSLAPLSDHFFAPGPYLPNMEFYPYSDALSYDILAQTNLNGWGFNLGRVILKPTVVFISFLSHLVTGNDFNKSMLVQSALYAVLPAVIYLFGSAIGGTGCGYLAAAFSILREWNALNAKTVLTIHSRLVMSEFLMQILFAAFCCAVFIWLKKDGREILYASIAGGTLALGIFTRYNFLAFIPASLLILIIGYRGQFRALLKPLLFFIIAALMTSAPMILRDSQMTWGTFSEIRYTIQDILIKRRFSVDSEEQKPAETPAVSAAAADTETKENELIPTSAPTEVPTAAPAAEKAETATVPENPEEDFNTSQITQELTNNSSIKMMPLFLSMINHGMHNIITSALILPMEPVFDDPEHLYKNEGDGLWRDDWQGSFSAKQWILIAVWIILLSAGCGVLIRMHGIAGISVIYFWAVYAFSIGFSRSSGGRYVVPCGWIPMLLLAFLCVLLADKGSITLPELSVKPAGVKKAAGVIALFTSFFICLILFEMFMPYRETAGDKNDRSILQERLSGVINVDWKLVRKQQKEGTLHITRGVVLYPRFYNYHVGEHGYFGSLGYKDYSRLAFLGINLNGRKKLMQEYMLPHQNMIDIFPQDSVYRAISCPTGNGYEDVLAVTIETPDGEVYTYIRHPLSRISCPVPEPVCISEDDCR